MLMLRLRLGGRVVGSVLVGSGLGLGSGPGSGPGSGLYLELSVHVPLNPFGEG